MRARLTSLPTPTPLDRYDRYWTEDVARGFVDYVVSKGGTKLDIYRLLNDETNTWPKDDWWWDIFEEFMKGE